jgi:hypothetical protein
MRSGRDDVIQHTHMQVHSNLEVIKKNIQADGHYNDKKIVFGVQLFGTHIFFEYKY